MPPTLSDRKRGGTALAVPPRRKGEDLCVQRAGFCRQAFIVGLGLTEKEGAGKGPRRQRLGRSLSRTAAPLWWRRAFEAHQGPWSLQERGGERELRATGDGP